MAECAWAKECEKPNCLEKRGSMTACKHGWAEFIQRVKTNKQGEDGG